MLSEYDWKFSPLIVDINGDLTADDMKEINVLVENYFMLVTVLNLKEFFTSNHGFVTPPCLQENFLSSRKSHEGSAGEVSPSIFLATTYDKDSEAWTASSPNSPVSISVNVLLQLQA